ncbi:MAG: hypothetical protein ABI683_14485 [Ginsengibacter sp.]
MSFVKKYLALYGFILLALSGCAKRNLYPDTDDPGLSRFTSHGYNIATAYINGDAYINPFLGSLRGNALPSIGKLSTAAPLDSLMISWQLELNTDLTPPPLSPYQNIVLMLPVSKSFTAGDFLLWNGQRFSLDSNAVVLNSFSDPLNRRTGPANIYFVKIDIDNSNTSSPAYQISGLFDGKIGDSITITKGRFDFRIPTSNLNF